jgi:pyruvate dehydrogenase E2 component (dihydrolipoamide acetyltransferase)
MGMYTEEGVLTSWLRPAGARVEIGEPIAEVTTEKATFEIPAVAAGILHPVAQVGTSLRVEMLMGYIVGDGEQAPQATLQETIVSPVASEGLRGSAGPQEHPPSQGQLRSSPAARRLAAQLGIDLTQIIGSGPGGRIVEADILAKVPQPGHESRTGRSPGARIRSKVSLSGNRRAVADRLRRSLSTAASTTLTREVDASALVKTRQSLAKEMDAAPSYDALFIRLFAAALRENPELNATLDDNSIVLLDEVHIGFAVAVSGGLVVPVVHNADGLSLAEVARAVRDLAERARANRLRPTDIEGGTASITNLGNHGVDAFTPILNSPESAILGIGRIAQRPVVHDGAVTVGHTCILSLTFDHRIADGIPAAQVLEAIARRMNDRAFLAGLL